MHSTVSLRRLTRSEIQELYKIQCGVPFNVDPSHLVLQRTCICGFSGTFQVTLAEHHAYYIYDQYYIIQPAWFQHCHNNIIMHGLDLMTKPHPNTYHNYGLDIPLFTRRLI
jgi:hypothetical protein